MEKNEAVFFIFNLSEEYKFYVSLILTTTSKTVF